MTSTAGPSVHVQVSDGVLQITIDRPQVRNAIDWQTAQEVAAALDLLDANPDIGIGILTGAGAHFSAGMDLKAFAETGKRPEVEGRGLAGLTRVSPSKPLIAAVEGFAVGGGFELVLACDMVVAAENAVFSLPEAKRGLFAGSGGLLRLPHRVPAPIAMELALTGRTFTVTEAHQWGLINRITPAGQATEGARQLAREVVANAPMSIVYSKHLLTHTANLSWDHAMAEQDRMIEELAQSADAREGARAFVERRAPQWGRGDSHS